MSLLILLSPLPGQATDSLGRLFTTPAERASLDRLRQVSKPAPDATPESSSIATTQPVTTASPTAISVQGYVKRSDGSKGTVWVNRQPLQEGSANHEIQVGRMSRDGNQVQLQLPAGGKQLNLKAGQIYLPESNQVIELDAHARAMQDAGTIGPDESADKATQDVNLR